MLFINFLCLYCLIVLANCHTISKSITYENNYDEPGKLREYDYLSDYAPRYERHNKPRKEERIHKATKQAHGIPYTIAETINSPTMPTTAKTNDQHSLHSFTCLWRKLKHKNKLTKIDKSKLDQIGRKSLYENTEMENPNMESISKQPPSNNQQKSSKLRPVNKRELKSSSKDFIANLYGPTAYNFMTIKTGLRLNTGKPYSYKPIDNSQVDANNLVNVDGKTVCVLSEFNNRAPEEKAYNLSTSSPIIVTCTIPLTTPEEGDNIGPIEDLLNSVKAKVVQILADHTSHLQEENMVSNPVSVTTYKMDPSLFAGFTSLPFSNEPITYKKIDFHITSLSGDNHAIQLRCCKDLKAIKGMCNKVIHKVSEDFKNEVRETAKVIKSITNYCHHSTTPSNKSNDKEKQTTKKKSCATALVESGLIQSTKPTITTTKTSTPIITTVKTSQRTVKPTKRDEKKVRQVNETIARIWKHVGKNRYRTIQNTTPRPDDDYILLSLYEQMLTKSDQVSRLGITAPVKRSYNNEKALLSKRNTETLTDLSLKENIQDIFNDGEVMPEISESVHNDGNKNTKPNTTNNEKGFQTQPEVKDITIEGLSDKLAYKDYINGYKYYLKFQKELKNENFSDLVKYQAHRHHNVDDIGKYILEKLPQVPNINTNRNKRRFFDDDTMDDQDVSTRSEDSWFKKHFYFFIDNGPPKKFHTSQTVPLKSHAKSTTNAFEEDYREATEYINNKKHFRSARSIDANTSAYDLVSQNVTYLLTAITRSYRESSLLKLLDKIALWKRPQYTSKSEQNETKMPTANRMKRNATVTKQVDTEKCENDKNPCNNATFDDCKGVNKSENKPCDTKKGKPKENNDDAIILSNCKKCNLKTNHDALDNANNKNTKTKRSLQSKPQRFNAFKHLRNMILGEQIGDTVPTENDYNYQYNKQLSMYNVPNIDSLYNQIPNITDVEAVRKTDSSKLPSFTDFAQIQKFSELWTPKQSKFTTMKHKTTASKPSLYKKPRPKQFYPMSRFVTSKAKNENKMSHDYYIEDPASKFKGYASPFPRLLFHFHSKHGRTKPAKSTSRDKLGIFHDLLAYSTMSSLPNDLITRYEPYEKYYRMTDTKKEKESKEMYSKNREKDMESDLKSKIVNENDPNIRYVDYAVQSPILETEPLLRMFNIPNKGSKSKSLKDSTKKLYEVSRMLTDESEYNSDLISYTIPDITAVPSKDTYKQLYKKYPLIQHKKPTQFKTKTTHTDNQKYVNRNKIYINKANEKDYVTIVPYKSNKESKDQYKYNKSYKSDGKQNNKETLKDPYNDLYDSIPLIATTTTEDNMYSTVRDETMGLPSDFEDFYIMNSDILQMSDIQPTDWRTAVEATKNKLVQTTPDTQKMLKEVDEMTDTINMDFDISTKESPNDEYRNKKLNNVYKKQQIHHQTTAKTKKTYKNLTPNIKILHHTSMVNQDDPKESHKRFVAKNSLDGTMGKLKEAKELFKQMKSTTKNGGTTNIFESEMTKNNFQSSETVNRMLVDTTLLAYDDGADILTTEQDSASDTLLKSDTKKNTPPKHYFATPVPMKYNEFENFLKENYLDLFSLTSPLENVPRLHSFDLKHRLYANPTKIIKMDRQFSKDSQKADVNTVASKTNRIKQFFHMTAPANNDTSNVTEMTKVTLFRDISLIQKKKQKKRNEFGSYNTKSNVNLDEIDNNNEDDIFSVAQTVASTNSTYDTRKRFNSTNGFQNPVEEITERSPNRNWTKITKTPQKSKHIRYKTYKKTNPRVLYPLPLSEHRMITREQPNPDTHNSLLYIESATNPYNFGTISTKYLDISEASPPDHEFTTFYSHHGPAVRVGKGKKTHPKRVLFSDHICKFDVIANDKPHVPKRRINSDYENADLEGSNYSECHKKQSTNKSLKDDFTKPNAIRVDLPTYYLPNTDAYQTNLVLQKKLSWHDHIVRCISGLALVELLNKYGFIKTNDGPHDKNLNTTKVFSENYTKRYMEVTPWYSTQSWRRGRYLQNDLFKKLHETGRTGRTASSGMVSYYEETIAPEDILVEDNENSEKEEGEKCKKEKEDCKKEMDKCKKEKEKEESKKDKGEGKKEKEECKKEKKEQDNEKCEKDNEKCEKDNEKCEKDNEKCEKDNEKCEKDNEKCEKDNEKCEKDNENCEKDNENCEKDNEKCEKDNKKCEKDNEKGEKESGDKKKKPHNEDYNDHGHDDYNYEDYHKGHDGHLLIKDGPIIQMTKAGDLETSTDKPSNEENIDDDDIDHSEDDIDDIKVPVAYEPEPRDDFNVNFEKIIIEKGFKVFSKKRKDPPAIENLPPPPKTNMEDDKNSKKAPPYYVHRTRDPYTYIPEPTQQPMRNESEEHIKELQKELEQILNLHEEVLGKINYLRNKLFQTEFPGYRKTKDLTRKKREKNNKNSNNAIRNTPQAHTAKDVSALEVIVDLVKNFEPESDDSKSLSTKSVNERSSNDVRFAMQSNSQGVADNSSLELHICIPSDFGDNRKKKSNPVRIRKVFSAIMSTPVDIEYQIRSFVDESVTVTTAPTVIENNKWKTEETIKVSPVSNNDQIISESDKSNMKPEQTVTFNQAQNDKNELQDKETTTISTSNTSPLVTSKLSLTENIVSSVRAYTLTTPTKVFTLALTGASFTPSLLTSVQRSVDNSDLKKAKYDSGQHVTDRGIDSQQGSTERPLTQAISQTKKSVIRTLRLEDTDLAKSTETSAVPNSKVTMMLPTLIHVSISNPKVIENERSSTPRTDQGTLTATESLLDVLVSLSNPELMDTASTLLHEKAAQPSLNLKLPSKIGASSYVRRSSSEDFGKVFPTETKMFDLSELMNATKPSTQNIGAFKHDYDEENDIKETLQTAEAVSNTETTKTKTIDFTSPKTEKFMPLSMPTEEIPPNVTISKSMSSGRVTLSKEFIAAVDDRVIQLFINLTRLQNKGLLNTMKVKRDIQNMGNMNKLDWEEIKKVFKRDASCRCKCRDNKIMCRSCAASNAVLTHLVAEFDNLSRFLNDHCSEMQAYLYKNPTGRRKLREILHRIERSVNAYDERQNGKCEQKCKNLTDDNDKINTENKYTRNDSNCFNFQQLFSLSNNLNKAINLDVCPTKNLTKSAKSFYEHAKTCLMAKNTPNDNINNVYSLDKINVNIICKPNEPAENNTTTETLLDTKDLDLDQDDINLPETTYPTTKKMKGIKKLFFFKSGTKQKSTKMYYPRNDLVGKDTGVWIPVIKTIKKRNTDDNNQLEPPIITDSGGSFWHEYINNDNRNGRVPARNFISRYSPKIKKRLFKSHNRQVHTTPVPKSLSTTGIIEFMTSETDVLSDIGEASQTFYNVNIFGTVNTERTESATPEGCVCETKSKTKTKASKIKPDLKSTSKRSMFKMTKKDTETTRKPKTTHAIPTTTTISSTKVEVTKKKEKWRRKSTTRIPKTTTKDPSSFLSSTPLTQKTIPTSTTVAKSSISLKIWKKILSTFDFYHKHDKANFYNDNSIEESIYSTKAFDSDDFKRSLKTVDPKKDGSNLLLSIYLYKKRREDDERTTKRSGTAKTTLLLNTTDLFKQSARVTFENFTQTDATTPMPNGHSLAIIYPEISVFKKIKSVSKKVVPETKENDLPLKKQNEDGNFKDGAEEPDLDPEPKLICDLPATCGHIINMYTHLPQTSFENYIKNIKCFKYRPCPSVFRLKRVTSKMPRKLFQPKRTVKWNWIRKKRFVRIGQVRERDAELSARERRDFEEFVRDDSGVYRVKFDGRKKRQSDESDDEVTSMDKEIFAHLGDTIEMKCEPDASSLPTTSKASWVYDGQLFHAGNVDVTGNVITVRSVQAFNDGEYYCKTKTMKKRVKLTVITLPSVNIVYIPVYSSESDCGNITKNFLFLESLAREMSQYLCPSSSHCSVNLHEPFCVRDPRFNKAHIQSTAIVTMDPPPLTCSVECRKGLLSALSSLSATNFNHVFNTPVAITVGAFNQTLYPVSKKEAYGFWRHSLEPFHSASKEKAQRFGSYQLTKRANAFIMKSISNMSPGHVRVLAACPAGQYLVRRISVCAMCPANSWSLPGQNYCVSSPRDTRTMSARYNDRRRRFGLHGTSILYLALYVLSACAVAACVGACGSRVRRRSARREVRRLRSSVMDLPPGGRGAGAATHQYSTTSTRRRPLSPSRVILTRLFNSPTRRNHDAQEDKFKKWKLRNSRPPVPPVDFDW